MTVIKQYNTGTSQWETIVTGVAGPTGATGATGATGPAGVGAPLTSSATAPVSPSAGDLWFNTTTGATFIYYNSAWIELGGGTMSPYQATSSTRPSSPWTGQTVYETDTNRLLVWNGTAWVVPNSPAQNPTGLELVTTVTCSSGGTASNGIITVGTTQSSVVITNAFSSTYDNYKIMYSGGTVSASTDIELTIGGSVTGYYGFLTYGVSNSNTILGSARNNTAAFPWVGGGVAGQASFANFEIMGPFQAAYTKIRNGSYQNDTNYGTMQGEHRVATSYTSFALAVLTGTMTGGTIRVYGYRNS